MEAILWSWAVSAVVLMGLAALLGMRVVLPDNERPTPGWLGMLVDARGRFSLNRLQVVVWSIVVVSLVAGVFFGRLIEGVVDPLNFTIPEKVLGLLGISLGTGVTVGAIKSNKSHTAAAPLTPRPAGAEVHEPAVPAAVGRAATKLASYQATSTMPFLAQIFMMEEGEYANDVVDVGKFQGFGFTIVLVVAYVATAIHAISQAKTAGNVTALPDLNGTFLVLLGISYAGYAGGKLPSQTGTPRMAGVVKGDAKPPVVK
jgi:hypothetical protein